MPVVYLGDERKISPNSPLEKFGLSVGRDGKISASDVATLVSKLEESLLEHRAQLEEIVEIKDHKAVCELEFAKICGNIECVLEEFSLETICEKDPALPALNNVVNIGILSK